MKSVPKPERKSIVFAGKQNVGKSSLINAITGEYLCAVNDDTGTTAPAEKETVDFQIYGSLNLIDTKGIDDSVEPDKNEVNKTIKAITYADFAVVVLDARDRLLPQEVELFRYLQKILLPYIIVINKIEYGVNPVLLAEIKWLNAIHFEVSCAENAGIDNLKRKMIHMLPDENLPPIIGDLVSKGDVLVLIVPENFETRKNRIILPQIQIIREALDEGIIVIVAKENELRSVLFTLKSPPDLVVADNQSVIRIAGDLPETVRLTTFSILMSRYKGDLPKFVKGLKVIDSLQDGDKVLITEACAYHKLRGDNAGKVKISNWLKLYTKKDINIKIIKGGSFPDEISGYKLIVHCEGCMLTRKAMQARIKQAAISDVPIVNYGVLNSFIHGAIPRALEPFSETINQI